jgi:hypothetical protein
MKLEADNSPDSSPQVKVARIEARRVRWPSAWRPKFWQLGILKFQYLLDHMRQFRVLLEGVRPSSSQLVHPGDHNLVHCLWFASIEKVR